MDKKYVLTAAQHAAILRQIEANTKTANRKKGEVPNDHPPAWQLIHKLEMTNQKSFPSEQDEPDLESYQQHHSTAQILAPYYPCTLETTNLKPITIAQMKLQTHHHGNYVVVRVLTAACRINAVEAIVEDTEGTATLLQLFNQPEEDMVPANEILRKGCLYLVKEPYFLLTAHDGSYSLRMDHVSDIMLLNDADALIPPPWKKSRPENEDGRSTSIRLQGNEAVAAKEWAAAERLYSAAIAAAKTTEEEQLAHLNRSLANLRLKRPAAALSDAMKSGPSLKSMFRLTSALYDLAKYDICNQTLETMSSFRHGLPSGIEPAVNSLVQRVKARIREQQTGQYDFISMYKQAQATPPQIDCATYSAPVVVKHSPGRGRGLFTTRKVAIGELLLCEKAFAYEHAGIAGQTRLSTQVIQRLYDNPADALLFNNLYSGEYQPVWNAKADGRPIVNSFLAAQVVSLISFGAPRTSRELYAPGKTLADTTNTTQTASSNIGMWALASYINHADACNCRRSFIGDMMILRAMTDLDAGTELTSSYTDPRPLDSYDEAQVALKHWGFKCDCAWCLAKKSTSAQTLGKRKALDDEICKLLRRSNATDLSRTLRLVEQLENTYPKSTEEVKIELWGIQLALADAYVLERKPTMAIEMLLRGLEALGFQITAHPPRDTGREQQPKFRIRQWGYVDPSVIMALLNMSTAYARMCPRLVEDVEKAARIAYRIIVGEDVTFRQFRGIRAIEVNPLLTVIY